MNCTELRSEMALVAFGIGRSENSIQWKEHLKECERCERDLVKLKEVTAEREIEPVGQELEERLWDVISARIEVEGDDVIDSPLKTQPTLFISLSCSYCHDRLTRSDARYCASCLAPHHSECFLTHGRCSTLACDETRVVKAIVEQETPKKRRRASLIPWFSAAVLVTGVAAFSVNDYYIVRQKVLSKATTVAQRDKDISQLNKEVGSDPDSLISKLGKDSTEALAERRAIEENLRLWVRDADSNLSKGIEIIQSGDIDRYEEAMALFQMVPRESASFQAAQIYRNYCRAELALRSANSIFQNGDCQAALDKLTTIKREGLSRSNIKRIDEKVRLYTKIGYQLKRLRRKFQDNELRDAVKILDDIQAATAQESSLHKLAGKLRRTISPTFERIYPAHEKPVLIAWKLEGSQLTISWRGHPKNKFVSVSAVRSVGEKTKVSSVFVVENDEVYEEFHSRLTVDPKRTSWSLEVASRAWMDSALKPYFPSDLNLKKQRSALFSVARIDKNGSELVEPKLIDIAGRSLIHSYVLVKSVENSQRGIKIVFNLNPNANYTVLTNVTILRREKGQAKYQVLEESLATEKNSYLDQTVEDDKVYEYLIRSSSSVDEEHPYIIRARARAVMGKIPSQTVEVALGPIRVLIAGKRD